MNKSIFIKIVILTLIIMMMFSIICLSKSNAISKIYSKGMSFVATGGDTVDNTIDTARLKKASDNIYNVLLAIGIIVAVIVGMVLGIQFMIASADEKAKVKEALIPFIVGCIVVFGAFTIWRIVINIGNSTESLAIYVEKTVKLM